MSRHAADPTFSYFPARRLEADFKRGKFNRLNATHRIFEVLEADTRPGKWTRGYRLAPDIDLAVNAYLRRVDELLPPLFARDGTELRAVPRAIASKNKDGKPASAWAGVKLTNSVPIEFEGLLAYSSHLERYARTGGRKVAEEWLPFSTGEMEAIKYRERISSRLVGLANSILGRRSCVPHRYEEIDCGRIHAVGVNLQGAPRDVRAAALHGLFESDLSNAHYAIIFQMAERLGVDMPEVRRYLESEESKARVRNALAARLGTDYDTAKTCLIAPIYGARSTQWGGGEIVKLLGADKARKLFRDPQYRAFKDEVAEARAAILKAADIRPAGSLTVRGKEVRQYRLFNALGKSIPVVESEGPRRGRRRSPAELLAHVVLGVEALMLRAVIQAYPDEVVLPRHDGWISQTALDVEGIQALILSQTGFKMTVKQEAIKAPEWLAP